APHRRSARDRQRDRAASAEPRPARADGAAGQLPHRPQPPHRGGRVRQAAPRFRRLTSSGTLFVIRLAIRVRREKAEMVLAELLELVPAGVEEVEAGDEVIEYGVYGAPGELPALPELRAAAAGALVEISTSAVADEWPARWRAYHRPVVVGDRLTVRPPWEPPDPTQL